MFWKHHLDKLGIVGSFIAAACCLGLPAVLSIVAAIGLGFIINDAILLPLMIVFLVVALIGLFFGYRVHRRPWPLALATVSAVAGVVAVTGSFRWGLLRLDAFTHELSVWSHSPPFHEFDKKPDHNYSQQNQATRIAHQNPK